MTRGGGHASGRWEQCQYSGVPARRARAGVDIVRIDGSFPSFSDDEAHIIYNEGFTGVSAIRRDGGHKRLLYKVRRAVIPASRFTECREHLPIKRPAFAFAPPSTDVSAASGVTRTASIS